MEVITPSSEKFSNPASSDEDEAMFVVRNKKKRQRDKTKTGSSPGNRISDDSDDEPLIAQKPGAPDKIDGSDEEEVLPQTRRKSRIVLAQESSDEEGENQGKEEDKAPSIAEKPELPVMPSEKDAADEEEKGVQSDEDKSSNDDDSADSSDDDSPPLRLFRNKNPTAVGESRGLGGENENDDLYDDEIDEEDVVRPDPSEVALPRSSRGKPRRPTMVELNSETQRLVRESAVNLPYHRPEPKSLSQFMKRPTLLKDIEKQRKSEQRAKSDEDQDIAANVLDNLPDLGQAKHSAPDPEKRTMMDSQNSINQVTADIHSEQQKDTKPDDGEESENVIDGTERENGQAKSPQAVQQETLPERPLTRRERLLQRLGSKLPQLSVNNTSNGPHNKFIDFDAENEKQRQSSGVTSLLQRFMKHSRVLKQNPALSKKVEISIIRKEERADGSGVELVTDVVTTTTGDAEDAVNGVKNGGAPSTPGQGLQRLKQRLAQKMKKRREIERKKREELRKLDNEELVQSESEEEDCDWSDGDSDEGEAELEQEKRPIEEAERRGNGVIDDTDDESESDVGYTQPFGGNTKPIPCPNPQPTHDTSLPRVVNEGSVMLFDESTRSSGSIMNKSNTLDGRITPALDRTCSDDSFYSSIIPLHQPEASNVSSNSQYNKLQLTKPGEFDDTCFENDSRSLSQPFRLEFEASQSQLLDADGFIREASITSGSKRDEPLLPPGAEDDNAMTDCNMSQLLDLCSAPFDNSLTPVKSKQENDLFHTSITPLKSVADDDVTEKFDDVTKDNEDSGDMFRNEESRNVDESFGFNVLPAEPESDREESRAGKFPEDENSDDEEPMTIVRKKKFTRERIAKDFLENEAELSGSEDGSDDEDDEEVGPNEYEEEEPVEALPAQAEIKRQVNRVHMRHVMEQDQREIELLQEAFMGGEEIAQRERKFRWKNMDTSLTQDMFKSDDEDSNHGDAPVQVEDSQWMKERLEREEFLRKNEEEDSLAPSEDSQLLRFGRRVVCSRQNSNTTSLTTDSNDSEQTKMKTDFCVDETSCSRDSFKGKSRKGSFLTRSNTVLSRLASIQEIKNINGPRNTDKMVFKAVSPKSDKRKRKNASDIHEKSCTKQPPSKRKKFVNINEDSNSVFDML